MSQNEILIEVLLVHPVHFGCVHKVNDLADTVDCLTVIDPDAVSDPSPYSRLRPSVSHEEWEDGIACLYKNRRTKGQYSA